MSDLKGARLSAMARCIRQAAYTALDTPTDPLPLDAEHYFRRGHLFNMYVGQQLRAKYGADGVRSEVEIPWPLGVGHADHVVDPESLAVEVVSTVTPSARVFEFKARQLKQYLHFGGYDNGAVYVIDPSSLKREDVLPVKLTDDDRTEIAADVTLLEVAVDRGHVGALPRVCRKPGDARGYLCQYASECFKDWQAPAASEDDREQARRAALDLYQAQQHERNLKAQLTAIEEERKNAQAALSDLLEPGETQVGPFLVKRIPIRGRVTVKNELLKAGLLPDELLAPYVSVSEGYDRFDITRVSDETALTGDDFGSEAPWSDDDLKGAA